MGADVPAPSGYDAGQGQRALVRISQAQRQREGVLGLRRPVEGDDDVTEGHGYRLGVTRLARAAERSRATARISVPAHAFTGSAISGSLPPTLLAINQTMNQMNVKSCLLERSAVALAASPLVAGRQLRAERDDEYRAGGLAHERMRRPTEQQGADRAVATRPADEQVEVLRGRGEGARDVTGQDLAL